MLHIDFLPVFEYKVNFDKLAQQSSMKIKLSDRLRAIDL